MQFGMLTLIAASGLVLGADSRAKARSETGLFHLAQDCVPVCDNSGCHTDCSSTGVAAQRPPPAPPPPVIPPPPRCVSGIYRVLPLYGPQCRITQWGYDAEGYAVAELTCCS